MVARIVQEVPGLRQRVVSMHPDEDESLDSWLIRRGEIEQLRYRDADVLVAPLLAIQRGFNILNETGGALLGSAFFLVRPYPVPDDLSQHIIGMNDWVVKLLHKYDHQLPLEFGIQGSREWGAPRHAYSSGITDLQRVVTDRGASRRSVPPAPLGSVLVVWQTIGRLVRSGREARVFFVDAAFHPQKLVVVVCFEDGQRFLASIWNPRARNPSLNSNLLKHCTALHIEH